MRAKLRDALDLADTVIREGREKVSELRTDVAPATELAANLKRAANAFENDSSPRIEIRVIGETRPLQPLVNDELYWIGREALTNAVRHAGATQIVVELTYDSRQLRLRCSDNGLGVDPEIVGKNIRQVTGASSECANEPGPWAPSSISRASRGVGTEIQVCVDARRAYVKGEGGIHLNWFARLWSHLESEP